MSWRNRRLATGKEAACLILSKCTPVRSKTLIDRNSNQSFLLTAATEKEDEAGPGERETKRLRFAQSEYNWYNTI